MSHPRKRLAAALSIGVGLSAALVGCASNDVSTGSAATAKSLAECDPSGRTITAEYAPQGEAAVNIAKPILEKQFPGLSVKLNEVAIQSYDQLTQAVTADIAAGSRPDVAMVGLSQVSYYVDRFKPQPLDESALNSTYLKRYLAAGTVDGTAYVAPAQVSVPALFMNKTLAAKAGITEAPTTMAQMLEDARKIKKATGIASVQLPTDVSSDFMAQGIVQTAGAKWINNDGTAGFDTDAGRSALSVYETLGKEGLQDPMTNAEATTAFNAGRIAFYVSGNTTASPTRAAVGDKFDWSVSALPVVDASQKNPALPAGGNGWTVLSQDSCQAAYAGQMIKLMLDPQALKASQKQYSYIPVDSQEKDELLAGPDANTQLGWGWRYDGTPTTWAAWPNGATGQANQIVVQMLQSLIRGADTKQTVGTAAKQINASVK